MIPEEAQTPIYTEGSLPERFDKWVKVTLSHLIKTEVRSYLRAKKGRKEVFVEDVNHLLTEDSFCDLFSEPEKETIRIGNTAVALTNERLVRAIGNLSHRKKQVIEATVIHELPVKQVASSLKMAEQTVMNYKYAALRSLKEQMETDSDG